MIEVEKTVTVQINIDDPAVADEFARLTSDVQAHVITTFAKRLRTECGEYYDNELLMIARQLTHSKSSDGWQFIMGIAKFIELEQQKRR